jgi:hypothetical protein
VLHRPWLANWLGADHTVQWSRGPAQIIDQARPASTKRIA